VKIKERKKSKLANKISNMQQQQQQQQKLKNKRGKNPVTWFLIMPLPVTRFY